MAPLHSLCLLESTAGRPAQRNRNLQKIVKVMQKVGKTEHLIDYLDSCIFTKQLEFWCIVPNIFLKNEMILLLNCIALKGVEFIDDELTSKQEIL